MASMTVFLPLQSDFSDSLLEEREESNVSHHNGFCVWKD
jgi:hypothetical protein